MRENIYRSLRIETPSPSERRQSLSSLALIKMYIFSGNYASSSAYFRVSSRIKSRRRRLVTKIIRNFSGTQRILFFLSFSKFLGDFFQQQHCHLPHLWTSNFYITRNSIPLFYILSSEGRYEERGWIELKKFVENSLVSRDVRSRKIRGGEREEGNRYNNRAPVISRLLCRLLYTPEENA